MNSHPRPHFIEICTTGRHDSAFSRINMTTQAITLRKSAVLMDDIVSARCNLPYAKLQPAFNAEKHLCARFGPSQPHLHNAISSLPGSTTCTQYCGSQLWFAPCRLLSCCSKITTDAGSNILYNMLLCGSSASAVCYRYCCVVHCSPN
jgi:hypothetical protein